MSTRVVHLLIPAVLGCCWLVVVLRHLPLPYPSDQLNYLNAGAAFPHGFPRPGSMHQVTRFGLVVPVRLAVGVFGYSEAAYHLVPILGTLTVLAGTYALGTLLFSPAVGAAAGAVVVTATPMFQDAAALLPDVPATGLFTVAAALTIAVRRGRWAGRRWPLLLIGALLGWSYLIREYIVFALPLIPALLVVRRDRTAALRRIGWAAAPMLVCAGVELALCQALYGDPLTRVHAILTQQPSPFPAYPGQPRAVYLAQLPLTLDHDAGGFWLTALLAVALLGALVWPRRLAVPLAWCALIWVPLTLAGGLLSPGHPTLRLSLVRYWFPLFPPLAVAGLGVLWLTAQALTARLRAVRLAAPALVLAVAAASAATTIAAAGRDPVIGADNGRTQMAALRSWMGRRHGARVLWADARSGGAAEVYRNGTFGGRRWPEPVRPITAYGPRPRPGDLVLFFDADRGRICGVCRRAERRLWGRPPRPGRAWRPVFATGDDVVRVYQVPAAVTPPRPRGARAARS
ncbi:MAG TPA: sialidase family protein [Streptosporangiaceae bacterium]